MHFRKEVLINNTLSLKLKSLRVSAWLKMMSFKVIMEFRNNVRNHCAAF